MKAQFQIDVAIDELFTNIATYAYGDSTGNVTVRLDTQEDPRAVLITFIDNGVPYNPLEQEEPDITLAAEDRPIGGLGIFVVKKTMDDMSYDYKDGQNILRIKKKI
jgi:anti-sigma regulatory factor (Ser/Thr protein kinase)